MPAPGGGGMIPRHIEDLWNRGFSLVPIRPGDKRPAVKRKEWLCQVEAAGGRVGR